MRGMVLTVALGVMSSGAAWGDDAVPIIVNSTEVVPAQPIGPLSISSDDYPSSALRNAEQGTTHVRYTIGIDGHVKDCVALGPTPVLESATCTLINRWHFIPASRRGKPVEYYRSNNISWNLPEDDGYFGPRMHVEGGFISTDFPSSALAKHLSGSVVVSYTVDIAGVPKDCIILKASSYKIFDDQACKIIINRFRYSSDKDKNGNYIAFNEIQHIKYEYKENNKSIISDYGPRFMIKGREIYKNYYLNHDLFMKIYSENSQIIKAHFNVNNQGHIEKCNLNLDQKYNDISAGTCKYFTSEFLFEPDRDVLGNPVGFEMDWDVLQYAFMILPPLKP